MNPNRCLVCGKFLSSDGSCGNCQAILGHAGGVPIPIDLDQLLAGKLLVTAQSGGGKSWALRRILEQVHAHVPQIILDREGEFFTLRERFDYIMVGNQQSGADIQIHMQKGEALARKILGQSTSVIVDLETLPALARYEYVRKFLGALIDAPRTERTPRLIAIDETHWYCPERGQPESKQRIIDLASLGRKRGLVALFATQRISKFSKDAAAECQNRMIGLTTLDTDLRRALDDLGMGRAGRNGLRSLRPGDFFVYGPAFGSELQKISVGPVLTTHMKPGQKLPDIAPLSETGRAALDDLQENKVKFSLLKKLSGFKA